MNAASAADIGIHIGRYVKQVNEGHPDDAYCRDLVDLLLTAPATTPADALALVSWVSVLLPQALAALPDDEGVRGTLVTALQMTKRAESALAVATGIPREIFTGTPARTN